MERAVLRYGGTEVEIPLEGAKSVSYLREKELPEIQDLGEAFRRGVEEAVGSPPLRELIAPGDKITIVISDITRYWMRQDLVLAELVDYLSALGIPDGDIAVLVALGTHRTQSREELEKIATPRVLERLEVRCHDAFAADLAEVGTTSRGTVVKVNPLAVGRKVILIGGTVHHLMSGFGGGRKSILPGISAKETIVHNHLMCLSPREARSSRSIGVGRTEGNPVHEDMTEAAALVNPVFSVNVVSNGRGKHCKLVCGHWKAAWEESCRVVQEACGVSIQREADVVVASCGGFPKDINLYQGVKTLTNMALAVKPGGTMIFLAECRDGGGAADFFGWNRSVQRGTLDADLRRDFTIGGYIFYAGCEAIAKGTVLMLTQIPPETVKGMGIEAYGRVEDLLRRVDFRGKDVAVIPAGGNTVPFLAGGQTGG